MFEQEIERKIEDFRNYGLRSYVPREGKLFMVDSMVSTVIGGRRTGKSYRALQAIDELVQKKFIKSPAQACCLDFDNPILSTMTAVDLLKIQTTFLKISPEFDAETPLIFLLDEIHKIPRWEEYVIDLSRNASWKVIVTGSSSKMLREDMATALRGKAISSEVYPLTFSEYLRFRRFSDALASTKGTAKARRLFDDYLRWGGYPAIVSLDAFVKEAMLREYFDTMILKDILQRYDVGKPKQCIHLYQYLCANIAKPYTLQSSFRYLKQAGFDTSRDTVRDYIAWAMDSWLIFPVTLYTDSIKEQERNIKKLYAIDWALANMNSFVGDGSLSRAFENLVYLHLRQRWRRVHYYLTRGKRQEVDFIAIDNNGKPAAAIQVCMDLRDPETLRRELEPLVAAADYFHIKNNFIITVNEERQFRQQGVTVRAVPAWKWLLEC